MSFVQIAALVIATLVLIYPSWRHCNRTQLIDEVESAMTSLSALKRDLLIYSKGQASISEINIATEPCMDAIYTARISAQNNQSKKTREHLKEFRAIEGRLHGLIQDWRTR